MPGVFVEDNLPLPKEIAGQKLLIRKELLPCVSGV